jgi:hypothetical protein
MSTNMNDAAEVEMEQLRSLWWDEAQAWWDCNPECDGTMTDDDFWEWYEENIR